MKKSGEENARTIPEIVKYYAIYMCGSASEDDKLFTLVRTSVLLIFLIN